MTNRPSTSPSTWRGVVKFDATDVELYRLVEKRANQNLSWDEIAAEIGCEVDPLCEWFIAFNPPRELPMVKAAPITYAGKPQSYQSLSAHAQRFANWRRQHEGASRARSEKA